MKAIIVIEIDEKHLLKEMNELYDRLHGYKCELISMPEKKEIKEHRTGGYIDNEDELAEARGWNACLKEIVGDINDGLQRCMGETE